MPVFKSKVSGFAPSF